jgi:formylglycine-generating enzyme required for sulfatase activity
VTCTPTAAGAYELTVTATADSKVAEKAAITVNDVGIELSSIPETVVIGQPVTITVTVTPEGTDFSISTDKAAAGCVKTNATTVTCTPTAADTYTLTITAVDKTKDVTITAVEPEPEEIEGMVFVKAGEFTMGCQPEQGRDDDKANCVTDSGGANLGRNVPAHQVTLTRDYYIGKYAVTQALWKEVLGAENNPSETKGDNMPVTNVTYENIMEFIAKLNEQTGRSYRLPTEAEWEFAARGGVDNQGYIYNGSNDPDTAWHRDNTVPARTLQPVGAENHDNELGIYDMCGNVNEVVSDQYSYYTSTPQTDPEILDPSLSPEEGWVGYRVTRGGGYYNERKNGVQVTKRSGLKPGDTARHTGFRLALTPTSATPAAASLSAISAAPATTGLWDSLTSSVKSLWNSITK